MKNGLIPFDRSVENIFAFENDQVKQILLPETFDVKPIPIAQYNSLLTQRIKKTRKIFKTDIIALSPNSVDIIKQIVVYSSIQDPVLFYGSPGSGRGFYANILHEVRGGKRMKEVVCSSIDYFSLGRQVEEFVSGKKYDGFLFREFGRTHQTIFPILESLIKDSIIRSKKKYIYFTSSLEFYRSLNKRQEPLKSLFDLGLSVNSISTRFEDVVGFVFWILADAIKQHKSKSKFVKGKAIKRLVRPPSFSSIIELIQIIRITAYRNRFNETIDNFFLPERLNQKDAFEEMSLSPLETSEKAVIKEHLLKNNYNKSKTARELKITINTLNSRIEKYGLKKEQLL